MPRSRGAEMPQRQSPRGPHLLRTSSFDSDPLHHRPITDRSPKLGDRRSPRGGVQSEVSQKKLGTRIADLESQLGQAQEELMTLKDQLVSAEADKKQAQEELDKKTEKSSVTAPTANKGKSSPVENQESNKTDGTKRNEAPDDKQQETDVYEVPVAIIQAKAELGHPSNQPEKETTFVNTSPERVSLSEPEKLSFDDSALKDAELKVLKEKLEEKERELAVSIGINDSLKKQLDHANSEISSAKTREKDMALRLSELEEELKVSKESGVQLKTKLEGVDRAKETLEVEMKKLRIQTEQWRKAADAAAAILAGGVEVNGRISERCSSMDKHYGGIFEPPAGRYNSFPGSPGMADYSDDGYGSGKRKGSGIKMLGDLWKKKGHK